MSEEATSTIVGEGLPPETRGPGPGLLLLFSEQKLAGERSFVGLAESTIGRGAQQQIFVEDPGMSRRHATFLFGASAVRVRDDGSHNGTFVNGVKIEGETPLHPGDVVRCGSSLLLLVPDVTPYQGWPVSARLEPMWGGPRLAQVRSLIEYVAPREMDVLVQGESGTGKELVVQQLHQLGGRSGPLVAVNCAAMPETLFESELFGVRKGAFTGAGANRPGLMATAAGGTFFLDEIGELPLALQPKLLRALELKEYRPVGSDQTIQVSLRLVGATNRDLQQEVEAGRFRKDLLHRIGGVLIQVPPLRERRDDIVLLAEKFLSLMGDESPTMTATFVEMLLLGDWPGNVRELRHVLQKAVVNAGIEGRNRLAPSHLPAQSDPAALTTSEKLEADLQYVELRSHLGRCRGNIRQVAEGLNVSRQWIYQLLAKYGIDPGDYR